MMSMRYVVISVAIIIFIKDVQTQSPKNSIHGLTIRFYNGSTFEESVKFFVTPKTRARRNRAVEMDELKAARGFNPKRATMLYVHGFIENSTEISVQTVMKAYLETGIDANLLLLDWSNMAYGDYFGNAGPNVDKVSTAVSAKLIKLMKSGQLKPDRLHLVGHSLGCHIAGSIGKEIKKRFQKIARITCLDPAFPGFYPAFLGKAISSSDAKFVDIIHTDAAHFGTPLPVGHVDFWPNGGYAQQPGCPYYSFIIPVTVDDFCSHRRSWHFYAESVRKPQAFPAVKCSEYSKFQKAECDFTNIGYMGFNSLPTLRGAYFLMTNGEFPYGRGMKGLKYRPK